MPDDTYKHPDAPEPVEEKTASTIEGHTTADPEEPTDSHKKQGKPRRLTEKQSGISIGKFSVENSVLLTILMVTILALGAFSIIRLPQEQFAEVPFFWVNVIVPYPGVSAADLEESVTIPIENAFQGISKLKKISSVTSEGLSVVRVEFDDGISTTEFQNLYQESQTRFSQVSLPEGVLSPVVDDFSSADFTPVIEVVISGDVQYAELRKEALRLQDSLLRVSDVADVDLVGARERQILIDVESRRMEALGLTPDEVIRAVQDQNQRIPGGTLTTSTREYLLRTFGSIDEVSDLEKVIVRRSDTSGGIVRVRDIARVIDGYNPDSPISRFNGESAISLRITKVPGGSSLDVVNGTKAIVQEELRELAPQGITLTLFNDSTVQINSSLNVLTSNAIAGLILLVIILWLFIGFRNAFMTALGIPVSFALTFIILDLLGETINTNTLFGLVLVLGLVVDHAIVIIENSYRLQQDGYLRHDAAILGTNQVVWPVIAATATTVAAFLPLMIIPGTIGKFLRVIPLTVTIALIASTGEALFFLPSHFADWGKERSVRRNGKPLKVPGQWFERIRRAYEKGIASIYRHRLIVLILVIAASGTVFSLVGRLNQDLFSAEDFSYFTIDITMPTGTPLKITDKAVQKYEDELIPMIGGGEVLAVRSSIGTATGGTGSTTNSNIAQILVDLSEVDEGRTRSIDEIIEEVKWATYAIPGPDEVLFRKAQNGPPTAAALSFRLTGDNYEQLQQASEAIRNGLQREPGVSNVEDDFTPGSPELRIIVNEERASALGLSIGTIGRYVRARFDGLPVGTFFQNNEEIDIYLHFAPESNQSYDDLLQAFIPTADGRLIPFSSIASIQQSISVGSIRRVEGKRELTITADAEASVDLALVNKSVEQYWNQEGQQLYPDTQFIVGGEFSEFQDLLIDILRIFLLGVFLIYLILGAQFNSYSQPFLILLSVPFAFVGVILYLYVSGTPFSTTVLYAGVALAGIAVNDAIVLISFINELRGTGVSVRESILTAAGTRLRPIVLTSLTTIAGLLPTALGLGGVSVVWGPMASTIIFGLLFSTLTALLIIPLLYGLLYDKEPRDRRRASRKAKKEARLAQKQAKQISRSKKSAEISSGVQEKPQEEAEIEAALEPLATDSTEDVAEMKAEGELREFQDAPAKAASTQEDAQSTAGGKLSREDKAAERERKKYEKYREKQVRAERLAQEKAQKQLDKQKIAEERELLRLAEIAERDAEKVQRIAEKERMKEEQEQLRIAEQEKRLLEKQKKQFAKENRQVIRQESIMERKLLAQQEKEAMLEAKLKAREEKKAERAAKKELAQREKEAVILEKEAMLEAKRAGKELRKKEREKQKQVAVEEKQQAQELSKRRKEEQERIKQEKKEQKRKQRSEADDASFTDQDVLGPVESEIPETEEAVAPEYPVEVEISEESEELEAAEELVISAESSSPTEFTDSIGAEEAEASELELAAAETERSEIIPETEAPLQEDHLSRDYWEEDSSEQSKLSDTEKSVENDSTNKVLEEKESLPGETPDAHAEGEISDEELAAEKLIKSIKMKKTKKNRRHPKDGSSTFAVIFFITLGFLSFNAQNLEAVESGLILEAVKGGDFTGYPKDFIERAPEETLALSVTSEELDTFIKDWSDTTDTGSKESFHSALQELSLFLEQKNLSLEQLSSLVEMQQAQIDYYEQQKKLQFSFLTDPISTPLYGFSRGNSITDVLTETHTFGMGFAVTQNLPTNGSFSIQLTQKSKLTQQGGAGWSWKQNPSLQLSLDQPLYLGKAPVSPAVGEIPLQKAKLEKSGIEESRSAAKRALLLQSLTTLQLRQNVLENRWIAGESLGLIQLELDKLSEDLELGIVSRDDIRRKELEYEQTLARLEDLERNLRELNGSLAQLLGDQIESFTKFIVIPDNELLAFYTVYEKPLVENPSVYNEILQNDDAYLEAQRALKIVELDERSGSPADALRLGVQFGITPAYLSSYTGNTNFLTAFSDLFSGAAPPAISVGVTLSAPDLTRDQKQLTQKLLKEQKYQAVLKVKEVAGSVRTEFEDLSHRITSARNAIALNYEVYNLARRDVESEQILFEAGFSSEEQMHRRLLTMYTEAFTLLSSLRNLELLAIELELQSGMHD